MARATPISSSFRHLKNLSNSSPPLHVTFRRPKTSCATTMSDDKVPHPSLEVIAGAGDKFLSAFKSLHNPYSSYPIVDGNLHIEAIFAAFFRSVRLRRECLRTKDDGSVALDWVSGDDRSLPSDSPLLILLFYSVSFLRDMYEVVAHVSNRYPAANLYAIGWSLGANILVRCLGHESHSCLLSGAVFLSNPFNLIIADEDFHKGFNNVYDKALANFFRKIFLKHALLFEDVQGEFNISLAVNTKTVDDELRFHYKCMYTSSLYPSKSFQPFTLHCSFLFVVIYRTSDSIYRSTVHGQDS